MLASEARKIAEEVSAAKSEEKAKAAYEYLINETIASARLGNFGMRLEISKLPFTKDILKKASTLLSAKGYSYSIKKEVTNWYSNTDYDEEEYFCINW
jgi:predicted RNase H-related nuclease YkuK (DUF458 family)